MGEQSDKLELSRHRRIKKQRRYERLAATSQLSHPRPLRYSPPECFRSHNVFIHIELFIIMNSFPLIEVNHSDTKRPFLITCYNNVITIKKELSICQSLLCLDLVSFPVLSQIKSHLSCPTKGCQSLLCLDLVSFPMLSQIKSHVSTPGGALPSL